MASTKALEAKSTFVIPCSHSNSLGSTHTSLVHDDELAQAARPDCPNDRRLPRRVQKWRRLCLSFFNCPNWQKTTKISWEHLPTFKFAVLYENGICSPSGKFTVADPVTEGSVTFSSPQSFRSVMVGYGGVASHKHKATSISKACPIEEDDEELIINFTYHRKCNAAVENATLSSNWHDDLTDQ